MLSKTPNGGQEKRTKLLKFVADYIFLFLMLAGIGVNFYFEMKVNKAIKLFTENQKIIDQHQHYLNQVNLINKKLDGLESNVRNLALTGKKVYIKDYFNDSRQIYKESIILTDHLRSIVSAENAEKLNKSIQQRIAFENQLVQAFNESGTKEMQKILLSQETMQSRVRFNLYYSITTAKLQSEILALNKKQDRDKVEMIALDYAIPHMTSFIFLVISFFILYKILQVYKLNKYLNEAVHKEQEAQRLKEQFMDNMTHELRSPLNAVLGYTGLLLKTSLKKDQEKFARAIRTSGELLLNVINEVLDYSKLKSGYMHFADEPFSLKDQLTALSAIVNDKLNEKGLQYEVDMDDQIPEHLRGDGNKLLQVLLNLTFNAIKFTAEGTISIRVLCEEKLNDQVKLKFFISDTGIGIAPEKLPHIFDRFYQVEDNVSKKYGGTGLGLSITKQIISLQGGAITVESEAGKGTTFIFTLTYLVASEFQEDQSGQPATGLKTGMTLKQPGQVKSLPDSMKVLIVDDNALNRDLLSYILKDFKVQYEIAQNGLDAIQLLKNENFHIVLMDIQMPGMDGRETTRKIRQELNMQIPVIALTAFSQPAEKKRCLEAGMNAYLSKPVKEKELLDVLELYAPKDADDYHIINIAYLKNLAQDNREFIDSVILKIAHTLPQDIASLREAVEANNHALVNQISHDMKTTFAVMGLNDVISEPLRYLESWNPARKNNGKLRKMLELIEEAGKQVTNQILDNFSQQVEEI